MAKKVSASSLPGGLPLGRDLTTNKIVIDRLEQLGRLDTNPAERKERARQSLATIALVGYLVLLTINIATPLVLIFTGRAVPAEAREVTLAITGALSGLVGVLGFVVGYYFKSEEELRKEQPTTKHK